MAYLSQNDLFVTGDCKIKIPIVPEKRSRCAVEAEDKI